MADVDRALSNVLRVGFRLGAFDPSTPWDTIGMDVVRKPEHLALALRVAQESMTLLSNRNNFLPLRRDSLRSVAVIGPAGDQDYPTGNYYGTPARKVGITAAARAAGCSYVQYGRAPASGPADAEAIARAVALAGSRTSWPCARHQRPGEAEAATVAT
jgi:beta-glucosidase